MSPDEPALRLQQQELVAAFGLVALRSRDLPSVLHEASVISARGLQTRFAKVLRYREQAPDFLVVSGVGWRTGVVGNATLLAGTDSPAGYAVQTSEPVLANDLAEEKRFRLPSLLTEHDIQSAINVVIGPVNGRVFGVLEADSTHRNKFTSADVAFLQAMANVLAAAIGRAETEKAKDDLLREKDMLMQEVHHRVKNSLQIAHAMLQLQARRVHPQARPPLEEAARRIMTIGAVHHRLYAGQSVSHTNAAEFLHALLADMRPMLSEPEAVDDLQVDVPSIPLDGDATTALGIVVSELVMNAVKYGARPVTVKLEQTPLGLRVTVEDKGLGFPPEFDPYAGSSGLGMRLVGMLANPAPDSVAIDRSVRHGRISVLLKS